MGEGKDKERERNISVCLPLARPQLGGPGSQPRHVPWLGIKPADPLLCRLARNPLSHTSQGTLLYIFLAFLSISWFLLSFVELLIMHAVNYVHCLGCSTFGRWQHYQILPGSCWVTFPGITNLIFWPVKNMLGSGARHSKLRYPS